MLAGARQARRPVRTEAAGAPRVGRARAAPPGARPEGKGDRRGRKPARRRRPPLAGAGLGAGRPLRRAARLEPRATELGPAPRLGRAGRRPARPRVDVGAERAGAAPARVHARRRAVRRARPPAP